MFEKKTNTQDVKEAKKFLLGHSRIVKEGIYFNAFNPNGVRLKEGMTREASAVVFQSALSGASGEMAQKTGYVIQYGKGRFLLSQADAKDPSMLFTGRQMKLNSLEEGEVAEHADVVALFDRMCDRVVAEFKIAVEAVGGEGEEDDGLPFGDGEAKAS